MSTLTQDVRDHVRAGFSGLWIVTEEPADAFNAIAAVAKENDWQILHWDADAGIAGGDTQDPVAALHFVIQAARTQGEVGDRTLAVFRHLHRFATDPIVSAALINALRVGTEKGGHIIVLAPTAEIPEEVARHFAILHQPLPERDKLARMAEQLAEGEKIPQAELDAVVDAAAGLTRAEAENAYSLSLVREGKIAPAAVWDLKTQTLEKSGVLKLHRGTERFDQLGGLEPLKAFATKALKTKGRVRARGLLLLGVPGTGKSAFAKALGAETGRPCLALDLASMFGSLVGQTEGQIRRALATADAMAPCVLFIDEVEKGLAGAKGGENDGGTAKRMFGTLLTWLNDHTSDVFVIATSNDVSGLPPEFARPGRFDALWMLDTPAERERAAIWSICRARYDIGPTDPIPTRCMDWTGAEVEACCRLASLLDTTLEDAARLIVPVAKTYSEEIRRLRTWAADRALDAQTGLAYVEPSKRAAPASEAGEGRRRIERD